MPSAVNAALHAVIGLLVFAPAFVADCLETIFEIGEEYAEDFKDWGGEELFDEEFVEMAASRFAELVTDKWE